MEKSNKVPIVLFAIGFLVSVILGYFIGGAFSFEDVNASNFFDKVEYVFEHPFHNWYNDKTIKIFFIFFVIFLMFYAVFLDSYYKKFMFGKEMGSAKWGNVKRFNKKLQDKTSYKNEKNEKKEQKKNKGEEENIEIKVDGKDILLSKGLRKAYNTKQTLLNNNILLIGGSGAGKTAGFIIPNLGILHGSNVVTDPKGDTLFLLGNFLEKMGTRVREINLVDMWKSHRYNPFKYIRTFGDITKLITNIIANTTPSQANSSDPFWDKAETLYLQATFGYTWMECNNKPYYRYVQAKSERTARQLLYNCDNVERKYGDIWGGRVVDEYGNTVMLQSTFRTFLMLLDEAEVSDDPEVKSPLDCRMEVLQQQLIAEGKDPQKHLPLQSYYKCIRGAGDTVRSIIISANARFAPFSNEELLRILDGDDIDLPSIGTGVNGDEKTKTVLFCVIPDDDSTYNFIPGMLYTQLFQELYRVARIYGGSLPIDVGFWFDEFANIKMPNDFNKIISTCRSRNIYIAIILQSLAQIKALYKDDWENVIGNCDTIIYLGGNEQSSHKYVSELLGKWTIDYRTGGRSFGAHGSTSRNDNITGRELMTPDEVKNMDNNKSIIFVRGQNPIQDEKLYWFKDKYFKNIFKDIPIWEHHEVYETEFDFLNDKALEFYEKDKTKDVHVHDFNITDFLLLDLTDTPHTLTSEEIENLMKLIPDVEVIEEEEIENTEEMDIGMLLASKDFSEEYIEELTACVIDNVPEETIRNIIEKGTNIENVRMIRKLHKQSATSGHIDQKLSV